MKTLNFLSAGDNAPLADGGLQFSKTMLTEKIEKHDFFERLFKIDEGVLERIVASMRKNGFDNSQPLHIWHTAVKDGGEHWYLIDGYTRFTACKKAGITRIPVTIHEGFDDFNAAYKYVLSLQVNRRNLTSDEHSERRQMPALCFECHRQDGSCLLLSKHCSLFSCRLKEFP